MTPGVIITAIICVAVAAISIVPMIQDYKLKKEKIKADAMVRAEEIKAKNQLELEKLMVSNNMQHTSYNRFEEEGAFENRKANKEKI
jgi:hypothetical protein